MRRYVWLAWVLILHVAFSLAWQGLDHQLPDGDEAGHLGAFYLFTTSIPDKGLLQTCVDAFTGPGDYPPAFYLTYALLFRLVPAHLPFPTGLGLWLTLVSTLTLGAVAGLAGLLTRNRRTTSLSPEQTMALAAFAGSTFPLFAAVSRQAMPEPFLALWVVVTLWAALQSEQFTDLKAAFLTGLGLLMALLTKQTTVLYLGLPLVWLGAEALVMRGRRSLPGLLCVLGVGLPLPLYWLALHWDEQLGYGTQSAEAKAVASWLDHLLYYPLALAGEGLGLFWTLLGGISLAVVGWQWWQARAAGTGSASPIAEVTTSSSSMPMRVLQGLRQWLRREHLQGGLLRSSLLCLSVGLLLVVVPKKYPRLLIPWLPVLAVWVSLWMSHLRSAPLRRGVVGSAVALGLVQQVAVSLPVTFLPERLGLFEPSLYRQLDPDCPQEWIRRASDDDLGFQSLMEAWFGAALPPFKGHLGGDQPQGAAQLLRDAGQDEALGSQIGFIEEPSIPCSYETTFNYAFHLSDYMRRRGAELDEVVVAQTSPEDFERLAPRLRLVVSLKPWCEGEDAFCALRDQFKPAGEFRARSERLHFTLYFYRRIQAAGG